MGRIDGFIPFPKVFKVKGQQPHPGFELGSPIPFSTTITVMLCYAKCAFKCNSYNLYINSFVISACICSGQNNKKEKFKYSPG